MSKIVIEKEQHIRDCKAQAAVRRGDWNHPLFMDGAYFTADKIGRKTHKGWTRWMDIRCNDPACTYYAVVNFDWVEEQIYKELRKSASPHPHPHPQSIEGNT